MKNIRLFSFVSLLLISVPISLVHIVKNLSKHYEVTIQDIDFDYQPFVINTQKDDTHVSSKSLSYLPIELPKYASAQAITKSIKNRNAITTIRNVKNTNLKNNSDKSVENQKQELVRKTIPLHIDYWRTVYSIESKQGKLLYRPGNKAKNCTYTLSACGHHQLTVQALLDIGCTSVQCREDRLDFNKSLRMSKKLLSINEERLRNNGITDLDDYQKYLIHQQGASGIKSILKATKGKSLLSSEIKHNMANNSPYSYTEYKGMGSKVAAQKFLEHWQKKWVKEKFHIAKTHVPSTDDLINPVFVPTFSDKELHLALNYNY